jgi:hypothetical protein
MRTLSCLLAATLLAGCAPSATSGGGDTAGIDLFELSPEKREQVSRNLDAILSHDQSALELGLANSSVDPSRGARAGKIPWHMEMFSTDLAISVSGWLGILTYKGTPGVIVYWRKQHPPGGPRAAAEDAGEDPATVLIPTGASRAELDRQLEPAIRAALATGRIQDEKAFRANLWKTAEDFRAVSAALERSRGGQWWVSRYRLDLVVDAQGKVSPLVTAGVEVRLRFEWHRIMKPARELEERKDPVFDPAGLSGALISFTEAVSQDLEELSENPGDRSDGKSGFKAFQYRVGLGVSYKGTVGIAKVTTSALGYVYFSRDVAKPVVNPAPSARPLPVELAESSAELEVIDAAEPQLARLSLREARKDTPPPGEMTFKIKREDFRKGLKKALKMGHFFGRSAEKAPKANGSWKVYELRAAFDLSLSGKTALANVQGLGSTEINFYNEGF